MLPQYSRNLLTIDRLISCHNNACIRGISTECYQMITPFGLTIRKLRLDKQQVKLKDMAEALGVTSSYLSAIEHGRKPIPESFIKKVHMYFKDLGVSLAEWKRLAEDSQPQLRLNLDSDRQVKLAFGRKFDSLPQSRKREIRRILGVPDD